MGVVYYKHESVYSGDTTVDRSLRCDEVDGNFFFLRGFDISTIGVDSDTNELILKRVNGETLRVDISQPVSNVRMEFDPETGTLTVKTPYGTQKITGFLTVDTGINVASDSTIEGTGELRNPIRVSATEKTGTFAAADEYKDLTDFNGTLTKKKDSHGVWVPEISDGNGNVIESLSVGKGYRCITKESVSRIGLLYNFDSVELIQAALERTASQWRIPSKEDWDKMLNSIEREDDCESSVRNHDDLRSFVWLGDGAGRKLKSVGTWKEEDETKKGTDSYGFSVLPVGYIDERNRESNVKDFAAFWTSTMEDSVRGYYIKGFGDEQTKVYQGPWDPLNKISIRLVKDYDGNNNYESEYIDGIGMTVPCVHMEASKTIWTRVNISPKQFGGVASSSWDEFTPEERSESVIYLLNEWDGEKWVKRQMLDGQSIVLRTFDDPEQGEVHYHEYIIFSEDGEHFELRDTVANIKGEIQEVLDELGEDVDELNTNLSAETEERVSSDEALHGSLNEEIARATSAETALHNEIVAEHDRAVEAEAALNEKIENEAARAASAETQLHEEIVEEANRAKDAEDELAAIIEAEGARAISAETALHNEIVAETTAREEAVSAEAAAREAADNALSNRLDDEVERAEAAETGLDNKIDAEITRATEEEAVLHGRDVNNDGHEFHVEEGKLKLQRENGDIIEVVLDTNFGTLPNYE